MNTKILSRENTLWMQGVSALLIMLMHFVMQLDSYPRFFNIFGSVAVAVFLFLSGYGINESYKARGLAGFWRRRFVRVVIPCWAVFLLRLPYVEHFDPVALLHDLTFTGSDLWFIDCIVRWYVVYWVARRFLPRHAKWLLAAFALVNVFQEQLFSEQALSFLAGFLVSEHVGSVERLSRKQLVRWTAAFVAYGAAFVLFKELPFIQQVKGTLPFNIVLLNIKLPLAMGIVALPTLVPAVRRGGIFQWFGKISYELYIVHFNFMPLITGLASVGVYSAVSVAISVVFRRLNQLLATKGRFVLGMGCLLFVGIGYLLMCKYSMRATSHFGIVCLGYATLLTALLLYIMEGKRRLSDKWATRLLWASLAAFVVLMLAVQYHFDPMENQVDRWSALAYPIRDSLHGSFPYAAKTHLGGYASPFPGWMLFHLPFYLLGNVGLSEIFTAVLFVLSVRRLYGDRAALAATLMLGASINLWYEVAVRSDLISNFLLLAAFVNYLRAKDVSPLNHPWLLACCAGLWLSTRLSTAFPLFVLWLPAYLQMTWKRKAVFPLLIIGVFALTFLPLIVWDADFLFGAPNNPFHLQFRQGSPLVTVVLVVLAVLMGLHAKGRPVRALFYAGLILVLVPAVSFGVSMYTYDVWTRLFEPTYDITYFDAALPFLVTLMCGAIAPVTDKKLTIKEN